MYSVSRILGRRTAGLLSKRISIATSCSPHIGPRNKVSLQANQRLNLSAKPFSTMSALRSAAPSGREFDPEIKDIASYVHNYRVDSKLAVSQFPPLSNLFDRQRRVV